ncbi:MAG TPA: hypothetical protein VFQ43_20375, partial [Nitrososphaera sp.]|nr:hypothetical protein [Nitrososphaera sp.]
VPGKHWRFVNLAWEVDHSELRSLVYFLLRKKGRRLLTPYPALDSNFRTCVKANGGNSWVVAQFQRMPRACPVVVTIAGYQDLIRRY